MKSVVKILSLIFFIAFIILLVRWGLGKVVDGVMGSSY